MSSTNKIYKGVYLSQYQLNRLKTLAAERQTNVSELIRYILDSYLDDHLVESKTTQLELSL
jgi:recombinational DNA repair protein (RecF pathway)